MSANPYVYRKDSLLNLFGKGTTKRLQQVLFIPSDLNGSRKLSRNVLLPAGCEIAEVGHIRDWNRKIAPLYAYTGEDGQRYSEYVQHKDCDTWGNSLYFVALKLDDNPVESTLWSADEIFDVQYGEWFAPLEDKLAAVMGKPAPQNASKKHSAGVQRLKGHYPSKARRTAA